MIEKVRTFAPGSKKDLEQQLDRVEFKMECELRYFSEQMQPLRETKQKLLRELKKLNG